MSEKFTKGPWEVKRTIISEFRVKVKDRKGNQGKVIGDVRNIENAKLIAAAPEMYEMLNECQREIEFLINEVNQNRTTNHSRYEDTPPDLYDQESLYLISKLLAKARGEL